MAITDSKNVTIFESLWISWLQLLVWNSKNQSDLFEAYQKLQAESRGSLEKSYHS